MTFSLDFEKLPNLQSHSKFVKKKKDINNSESFEKPTLFWSLFILSKPVTKVLGMTVILFNGIFAKLIFSSNHYILAA